MVVRKVSVSVSFGLGQLQKIDDYMALNKISGFSQTVSRLITLGFTHQKQVDDQQKQRLLDIAEEERIQREEGKDVKEE